MLFFYKTDDYFMNYDHASKFFTIDEKTAKVFAFCQVLIRTLIQKDVAYFSFRFILSLILHFFIYFTLATLFSLDEKNQPSLLVFKIVISVGIN